MNLIRSNRWYAWFLTAAGGMGLVASFVITLEKQRLLQNPNYIPACSINPIISCGSVMKTVQASVFGFPNSWLGLIGFMAVIVVGVSVLAGAEFKIWYWRLFNAGTLFGVVFVHWLFVQSVYHIHALCPWCMVVWSMTIPIFWYTTMRNFREGVWLVPKAMQGVMSSLQEYKNLVLVVWYLMILSLIGVQFWYYWKTIL